MSAAIKERSLAMPAGVVLEAPKAKLPDIQTILAEKPKPAKPFERIGGPLGNMALFLADNRRSPGSKQDVLLVGESENQVKGRKPRSYVEIREGGLNGEIITRYRVHGNPNEAFKHAYARTGEVGAMALKHTVPESKEVVHQSELAA